MDPRRSIDRKLRTAKRIGVGLAAHRYQVQGFSERAARRWARLQARDLTTAKLSTATTIRRVHQSGATAQSAGPKAARGGTGKRITLHDYLLLDPINKRYRWLLNRATAYRFVPGLAHYLPTPLCTVFSVDGAFDVVRLANYPDRMPRDTSRAMIVLLERYGALRIQPIQWDRGLGRLLEFDGLTYYIDGWPASEEDLLGMISAMSSNRRCVITAEDDYAGRLGETLGTEDAVLRLYVGKYADGAAKVLQADCMVGDHWRPTRPSAEEAPTARVAQGKHGWGKRRETLALNERRYAHTWHVGIESGVIHRPGASRTSPDGASDSFPNYAEVIAGVEATLSNPDAPFTFVSVDLGLKRNGDVAIVDISPEPVYPRAGGFATFSSKFLNSLLDARSAAHVQRGDQARVSTRTAKNMRKMNQALSTFRLRAEGFTGRSARTWVRRVRDARATETSSVEQREKALKAGFLPGNAARLGINETNAKNYVPLRDYLFVQPLNGTYAKWVRDRVSTRKVFEPFHDFFEPVHFQVMRRNQELQVLPISDQAKRWGGYGAWDRQLPQDPWAGRPEVLCLVRQGTLADLVRRQHVHGGRCPLHR